MKSRRITLIVAVVLAVATGLLTLGYLSSLNKKSQIAVVDTRPVVIANLTIPARTKIKAQMLTKVMRPTTSIEPGAIDDPKEVEGDIALATIPAGTPLMQSKVGIPASIGITGRLKPGQRAVSIPVDMVKSVSALIEPGDRVDVMASLGAVGTHAPRTAAIIRGATILAVNSNIDPSAQASPAAGGAPAAAPPPTAPTTVTLAVSAEQADLLTVADLNSTLRLALRSPDESVRSVPPETISFAAPAAAAAAAGPGLPAAAGNQPVPGMKAAQLNPATGVVLIDGDKSSIVPR